MARARTVKPTEETIASAESVGIFVRSWKPANARAVVVICHGVMSHGGQYVATAQELAKAGYAVYALDLRGRGKSEGARFVAHDISEYVADVWATIGIARARNAGQPVFLLGHSAGGVTSAIFALDNKGELAGFICESFAYKVYAPGFVLQIVKLMAKVLPRLPVLRLKNSDFSRDPEVVAALEADPLTKGEAQPAVTVAALVRATERLAREFPRITVPLLVMHGTADKVTVPAGSEEFFAKAGSTDKTLKLYDGHVHDLLSDIGKEQVLADILAWIAERIPVPEAPAPGA